METDHAHGLGTVSVYCSKLLGRDNPAVSWLGIGSEEMKPPKTLKTCAASCPREGVRPSKNLSAGGLSTFRMADLAKVVLIDVSSRSSTRGRPPRAVAGHLL